MRTLALYSIKGGVGKTSAAVNLAYLAAQSGLRTCLWDLDPQGASSFYFRVKPRIKGGADALLRKRRRFDRAIKGSDLPGLDILPADFSLRDLDLLLDACKSSKRRLGKRIAVIEDEYDVLLIDCAPSISLVSENVFRACDALIVPLIPSPLSIRTYETLTEHLSKSGLTELKVLAFFSMVDSRRKLHREIVADWIAQERVLGAVIPYATQVEAMGIHRASVFEFAPKSPASEAYRALWQELLKRVF